MLNHHSINNLNSTLTLTPFSVYLTLKFNTLESLKLLNFAV